MSAVDKPLRWRVTLRKLTSFFVADFRTVLLTIGSSYHKPTHGKVRKHPWLTVSAFNAKHSEVPHGGLLTRSTQIATHSRLCKQHIPTVHPKINSFRLGMEIGSEWRTPLSRAQQLHRWGSTDWEEWAQTALNYCTEVLGCVSHNTRQTFKPEWLPHVMQYNAWSNNIGNIGIGLLLSHAFGFPSPPVPLMLPTQPDVLHQLNQCKCCDHFDVHHVLERWLVTWQCNKHVQCCQACKVWTQAWTGSKCTRFVFQYALIQCQSSVHQVWTHMYSQTSAYNTEAHALRRDCHAYTVTGGSIVYRCCCMPVSHNINDGNFVWVWKLVLRLRVIPHIVPTADLSPFLHNQSGDHR